VLVLFVLVRVLMRVCGMRPVGEEGEDVCQVMVQAAERVVGGALKTPLENGVGGAQRGCTERFKVFALYIKSTRGGKCLLDAKCHVFHRIGTFGRSMGLGFRVFFFVQNKPSWRISLIPRQKV
jgi:hypothetical protein